MFKLGEKSLQRLRGVHPDLVAVVHEAIKIAPVDFRVIEGLRSIERQRILFDAGKSKTMNSRHITGHAVDLCALVGGVVSWEWQYYEEIARTMKWAASSIGIPIEWGGDWKFRDGPHFQLPLVAYPAR